METQRIADRRARREGKRCSVCGQRFTNDAAFCPFDGTPLEAAGAGGFVDPLIGVTVDERYEIRSLLGEGGMGHVYEVRHVALDRHFAMKVLRRDLAKDPELSARFIQEAKATASVRHPNVVEITDFGRIGGVGQGAPYFVMELLIGETLGRVIKSGGPIPAARAVRILKPITAALAAAHASGIVHRDLKPDNIFLVGGVSGGAASDDVRVVDFGAAKIIGSSRVTRKGIVFGTPHYMSPEQASGQPVDHRADVYALGVIMYEMFTGRVPFEADTYMGVLTQHMFVKPMRPSEVHPAARELGALEEITMVCLAKKPEERYSSMQALADALERMESPRCDAATQGGPSRSVGPSRARPGDRYRMADELEPPTLAEMRKAIDSVLPPKRAIPWGWILGLAGVAMVGLALWMALAPAPTLATPTVGPAAQTVASVPLPTAPASAPATAPSPVVSMAPPSATASNPSIHHLPPKGHPPEATDDIGDPFAGKRR